MSSSVRPTRAAATFSTTCATVEVPGMGKMTGDRASSHANATCEGVTFFRADSPLRRVAARKRTVRARQLASRQGKPRNEDDVVLLTVFQNVLRAAIGHAIAILYARDGHDRARVMKLAHAHLR